TPAYRRGSAGGGGGEARAARPPSLHRREAAASRRAAGRGPVDAPGGASRGRQRRNNSPRPAARRAARHPGRARPLEGPQAGSERDARTPGGVAVKRHEDRALARRGLLNEAPPRFVAAEGVRYGGAWLALPALLALGILEAGEQTYGVLKK